MHYLCLSGESDDVAHDGHLGRMVSDFLDSGMVCGEMLSIKKMKIKPMMPGPMPIDATCDKLIVIVKCFSVIDEPQY